MVRGDEALRAKATPMTPPKPITLPVAALDRVIGTYQIPGGPKIRVYREGSRLLGAQEGQSGGELVPESETAFFVLGESIRLAFEKDAAGKVAVMVLKVPGQEIRANRVECRQAQGRLPATNGGPPMTRRSRALLASPSSPRRRRRRRRRRPRGPGGDAPDTILYGAAYYHEYMPYERLDKDIELMKRAGITVVRVGESTWTSWEPREGEFQFAWMDRIVDEMHAAGIKVVMGTPTYSIPPWLYAKHPEVMVVPLGQVRTPREFYGMRQNMDISHPVYRQYCERVIRKIAERYGKHPGVIGWQVDNETGAYGTAGPNVQAGFKEWLKRKFGTVEAMNKAWGLVYWGQLVGSWDELPPARRHPQPRLEARVGALPALAGDGLPRLAGEARPRVRRAAPVGDPGLPRRHAHRRRLAGDLEVPRRRRDQPVPRHAGAARRLVDRVHGRLHALDEAGAVPRHRDERADDRLGREGPVPAVRRAAAAAGVGPRRERGPHGRVLALALAPLRPGDLLEGAARPRPRAEPRLRGGDPHRRRAEAPRPAARGHDAEEPRRHPAQRRLALGPAVHAHRGRREGRAREGRRRTTRASRTSCTGRSTT